MTNNNLIKTTSRTFDEIVRDARDSIPALAPDWTSHGIDEPGMAIIELTAGMVDALHFYLDKQILETYLPTARLRSSIVRIANTIGYRPHRWVAPLATMTITCSGYPDSIIIPARSQFRASAGMLVASADSIAIPAGFVGSLNFTIYQGVVREINKIGTGLDNYTVTLQHDNVAEQMLEVLTDGTTPWFHALNHPLDYQLDRLYYTNETVQGDYQIVFRAGRAAIPPEGSEITIKYLHTDNIAPKTAGDLLPQFTVPGIETLEFHHGVFSDGKEPESIESIRQRAPANIYSRNRAVTLPDYQVLSRLIPTVKNVYVVKDISGWRSVDVYVALETPTIPSPQLLGELQQYLSSINEVTVDVRTWPATLAPFSIGVNIKVLPNYSVLETQTQVRVALEKNFGYEALDIAKTIRLSDVYQVIETVPGVDYSDLYLLAWTGGSPVVMNLIAQASSHPYLNNLTVGILP